MPSLQTWINLSEEQEAKQVLFCQSTSRVGAAGEQEEGGEREREREREGGGGTDFLFFWFCLHLCGG